MSPEGSRGKKVNSALSGSCCAARPSATRRIAVLPLTRLEFSMRDVYHGTHWAITGTPPAYDTPDEDVYLHGRNIALLSKAAVYAASRKISRIVVAPLAGNPFPDATPQFFAALNAAFSLGSRGANRDCRAVRTAAQGKRREARRPAGCAVRADALVHEPVRNDALRVVQQVPGTAGRLSGGRDRRPDDVRQRQPQVMTSHRNDAKAQRVHFKKEISASWRRCGETAIYGSLALPVRVHVQFAAEQRHARGVHAGSCIWRRTKQHAIDFCQEALELRLVWRAHHEDAAAFCRRKHTRRPGSPCRVSAGCGEAGRPYGNARRRRRDADHPLP